MADKTYTEAEYQAALKQAAKIQNKKYQSDSANQRARAELTSAKAYYLTASSQAYNSFKVGIATLVLALIILGPGMAALLEILTEMNLWIWLLLLVAAVWVLRRD